MPSVLFASPHSYLEPASGAMVAMRDLLHLLSRRGWTARALTGPVTDVPGLTCANMFAQHGVAARTLHGEYATTPYAVHRVEPDGVSVTLYEPDQWKRPPTPAQGNPLLQLLDRAMLRQRPDVLLTFGVGWVTRSIMAVGKRHGVPVVFWLRSNGYDNKTLFEPVAGIIVASEYTADHYARTLGLKCDVIPSPVRPDRVVSAQRRPRFVTFISPMIVKGAAFFARIASELGKQRPDIPVLAVIGRGDVKSLAQAELNLKSYPNFRVMQATTNPLDYWSVTRVLVAPSLWDEPFMRVAVEAMLNGIPTLASRRGGIPGTLGQSGFLYDIPARFTPADYIVPTPEEVAPWVTTLIRLWDDDAFYRQQSERSLAESRRFAPEAVISAHEAALRRAMTRAQPRPHMLPPLANQTPGIESFNAIPSGDLDAVIV